MFKSYLLFLTTTLAFSYSSFGTHLENSLKVQSPSIAITSLSKGISTGSSTSKNVFKLSFITSNTTNNFNEEDIILYNAEIVTFSGKNDTYNAKLKILNKGIATVEVYGYSFTDSEGNFNVDSDQFIVFKN